MKALPLVEKEISKLPRAYIGNIMMTIIGEQFAHWVEERVKERNAKIKEEREMGLEMDPEIA